MWNAKGGGTGLGMLGCHGLDMCLQANEEVALEGEWMDGVVWGSVLLGGGGLELDLGLEVWDLGWGRCLGVLV